MFNPVALFEFFTNDFILYFRKRLFGYVNNINSEPRKPDSSLELIGYTDDMAEIKDQSENIIYNIPEAKCQCKKGADGSSCRHSFFLAAKGFMVKNEKCIKVKEEKEMLYFICEGKMCENINFFGSIHEDGICLVSRNQYQENSLRDPHQENNSNFYKYQI